MRLTFDFRQKLTSFLSMTVHVKSILSISSGPALRAGPEAESDFLYPRTPPLALNMHPLLGSCRAVSFVCSEEDKESWCQERNGSGISTLEPPGTIFGNNNFTVQLSLFQLLVWCVHCSLSLNTFFSAIQTKPNLTLLLGYLGVWGWDKSSPPSHNHQCQIPSNGSQVR